MVTPKKRTLGRGLGRGLSALMAQGNTDQNQDADLAAATTEIDVQMIQASSYQPRHCFDEQALQQLCDSIQQNGVLMPVLLRPIAPQGHYELVAGERRWRAVKKLGLKTIPAVVRELSDQKSLELAIIENEQRHDLSAIESGRAYKRLVDEFQLTQKDIAEHLGISRVQVSNLIRLTQLCTKIQQWIEDGSLQMGHGRALVGLDDTLAIELAERCIHEHWSVRRIEKAAKQAQTEGSVAQSIIAKTNHPLVDTLSKHLAMTVNIRQGKKGQGQLSIHYQNQDELDRLMQTLTHKLS